MNTTTLKSTLSDTLKTLCLQPGITGRENETGIVSLIINMCKQYGADTVEIDTDGNVVATIGDGSTTVLMEAHLDEVGFEVLKTNKEGVYILSSCGNVDGENIDGAEAFLLRSGAKGILEFNSKEDFIFFKQSVLNTEAVSGDPISFTRKFSNDNNIVRATALDNRIGCAVLFETLRQFKMAPSEGVRLILVFSLGEETSSSSLKAVVDKYKPDLFIVVDAAYAHPIDFEIFEPKESIPSLGDGCVIQHKGVGFTIKPQRIVALAKIAKENDIKIQRESVGGDRGRTNFTAFLSAGVDTGIVINVPVQNQHRDISTTNLNDAVDAVKLLFKIVGNLDCLKSLILPEKQMSGVSNVEGVL